MLDVLEDHPAHAARATLVTVEEIVDGDLLADEALAAGTIPALYVSGIAEVAKGNIDKDML